MPKIKRKKEEQKRDPSPTWSSLGQPKKEEKQKDNRVKSTQNRAKYKHFQNTSLLGTANSLQLALPVVSNAASLTGSNSNSSRASAPAVSSAWLLPSASGTSIQPLTGRAYLYQHSSTTMLSGVSGQSHSSTSAASYPGIFEWDITVKTANKSSSLLRDFTATGIDQNTAVSSMSMTAQHDKTSDANIIVPLYPTLSASLVQRTQSQIPNQQGHSLSLPYQTGSQVYYYNPGTLGPQLSGELGPWLQSYGSVSYPGNRASAHQPEMVMVLKEVQPTKVLPPVSTSGMHYSVSAQRSTETSFQVMETSLGMDTSLGLQSPSQTFCLAQTPEFSKSCSSRNAQILESNPSPELGDISMTAPVQSPTNLLTVSPAPSQDKTENKNLDEIKTKISKPLDAYQFPIENQNPPLLPLEIPDTHQRLSGIDPLGQEVQPGSKNANLRKNSLSLQCQRILENGFESSSDLADVTTLVENTHLSSIFSSLQDPDQPQSPSIFSSLQDPDEPKSPSLFSSLQNLDQSQSPSLFSSVQDLDQPQSPSISSSLQDLDKSKSPSIFSTLQGLDQPKSPSLFSFLQNLDQSKSPSIFNSLQDLDQPKSGSIFSSVQDLDQPQSPSISSSLQDLDQPKSGSIFSSVQDLDQPQSPSISSSLQDLDQPKSPSIFSTLQDPDQPKSPSIFSNLQDLDQPKSPSIFSSIQDLDQSKSPFIFSDLQDYYQPKSPYIFTSFDQSKSPLGKKAKDLSTIKVNQVQEKSSVIKSHSDQGRKKKHKAVEPIQGAPKAKIQPKNTENLLEGEVAVCSATASDSASVSKGKRSSNKHHKATSSRSSTTKRHGQEKTKRSRENSSKKSGDGKQSGTKVKVEEKPAIPNRKRKKNQPELSQKTFKKPQTSLGMHMLESVQVFHALGKKTDKKTGFSSSRTLGSSGNTQNPRPFSALKPWLATPCEGKGLEKTQVKAQILDDNAEKESPSPTQYELPPPGKVKLVPLPFLTPGKPQARPVSRRPHPPASRRPAVTCPSPPGSTNSAQSTAVSPSQPAPTNTSLTGPARPAQPISTNATEPGSTNPNQPPTASQSAASRPAPYKTSSCSSLQREPVCTAVTNLQSLPKPQNQFLIQDFSLQRRPWRTPDISGPVESTPITKEQRPEREAMKRKAQQERENAAKHTSFGKLQFLIQREKDMEISEYYGYRF
ncbi:hypothetical protein P7K49_029217 [Saguinus oedipus]|uniref:DUF4629 domain-containing protein n=1 Tax=Saguinus oedipus TaxID=9490 RepID=A0ABQ9U6J4_SAGOE|nr:hypothetical protein P7K49_029217 [Saguinus oedipus]